MEDKQVTFEFDGEKYKKASTHQRQWGEKLGWRSTSAGQSSSLKLVMESSYPQAKSTSIRRGLLQTLLSLFSLKMPDNSIAPGRFGPCPVGITLVSSCFLIFAN